AVVGVADIQARPLADRVEAYQHLDGIGAVAVVVGGVCHSEDIGNRWPKPKEKHPDSAPSAQPADGAAEAQNSLARRPSKVTSTRRLRRMPAAVALEATGLLSPWPV